MSCYTFIKINDMKHNGNELFYMKPINVTLQPATEFNACYNYFYKSPHSTEIKPLGTFLQYSKRSSMRREDDYDYDVFEFTNDYVSCSEKAHLYCIGIPVSMENMMPLANMVYNDYPIYYYSPH